MDDDEHKEWLKREEERKQKYHVPRPESHTNPSEPEESPNATEQRWGTIDDTRDD